MAGLLDIGKNLRLPANFVPDVPKQQAPQQNEYVKVNIPGIGEINVPNVPKAFMGQVGDSLSSLGGQPQEQPQAPAPVQQAQRRRGLLDHDSIPGVAAMSNPLPNNPMQPPAQPMATPQPQQQMMTPSSPPTIPAQPPVTPPVAQNPEQGGIMGWLNSDQGKSILSGLGAAMSAKAADRHSTMTPEFEAGMAAYKKKADLSALETQLKGMNLTPEQKALLGYAVQSQDPKLLDSVSKSIFATGKAAAPYTMSPGQIRYDAQNHPVVDRSKDQAPGSQLAGERLSMNKWSALSMNQRQALVAQAAGMGIDPVEANNRFIAGESLNDMAKRQGLDPHNMPTPIFPTTTGSLTKIQRRQQALAEMDSLGKKIAKWTEPYAQRWHGWSAPAITDAMSGKNTEQLSEFLAAKGLALEQAAIRTNALGGQVGEGILHAMVESSMGHIEFPTSLVNSELYKKTQEKIDSAIHESVQKANKVGLSPGLANEENQTDKYQLNDLDKMAQEAIAKGADPNIVNARLIQLKSKQNG